MKVLLTKGICTCNVYAQFIIYVHIMYTVYMYIIMLIVYMYNIIYVHVHFIMYMIVYMYNVCTCAQLYIQYTYILSCVCIHAHEQCMYIVCKETKCTRSQ